MDDDYVNIYESRHLGRYIWVYFIAPLVASMLAGYLAKI